MVYTDGVHMVADSVEELHKFAHKIGMRRHWFQDHPRHPHYDLLGSMFKRAKSKGALVVNKREILMKSKSMIK